MDLTYSHKQKAFRQEVPQWLADNLPATPLASYDTREGFEQHRQWEAKLFESRLSMVMWPTELGGRGCDLIEWLIFEEEYYGAGAPMRVNQNGQLLLGPTLMEFGTEAQKKRFLPRMAASADMWAQGWSEPNAGSDMAAITSKASRDGDSYVLNGQKTWSTRAIFADWLFGLFRSDPGSSRHHGLSFVMVPLNAPGVTVRPIKALNGKDAFAEVFFDDVRIPLQNRLGSSHPKLTQAVLLMEANIEEPLTTDEIAQHVCVSRRQLERIFKQYLNRVPSQYYLELRLNKARQMLMQTSKSIIQIGLSCGFSSGPHFSSAYRNFFGATPREDRNQRRSSSPFELSSAPAERG